MALDWPSWLLQLDLFTGIFSSSNLLGQWGLVYIIANWPLTVTVLPLIIVNEHLEWILRFFQIPSIDRGYVCRLSYTLAGPMRKSRPPNFWRYQHRIKNAYRIVSLLDEKVLTLSLPLFSLFQFFPAFSTFLTVFRLSCFFSFFQCKNNKIRC